MKESGKKLSDMRLREDQVKRLLAAGCKVNPHMDISNPPISDEEPRHPIYDVLLPDNTVVRFGLNKGEAILRRKHEKTTSQVYEESFSRKLTWVRDENGSGKMIGFTLQFD